MISSINGIVIKGKSVGKTLGFPTANIKISNIDLKKATYKINVIFNGQQYSGVGVYLDNGLFEAHILGFNHDIYGKEIQIIILEKLRDNKKFDTTTELKKQIKQDIIDAKKQVHYVITFGSFDEIHPGHEYFLNQAKQYGDRLITIVANGKNVIKFKGKAPKYNGATRVSHVENLNISDMVYLGRIDDPLSWIKLYNPRIVCLGYDQIGFSEDLEEYIKVHKLRTKVIRIDPYKKHIYKSSIIKNKK